MLGLGVASQLRKEGGHVSRLGCRTFHCTSPWRGDLQNLLMLPVRDWDGGLLCGPRSRKIMTPESTREFHESRALAEKLLAEQATDSVQSIPHDQLSRLHAEKAETIGADLPLHGAVLDATAVDGNVIIVAAGEVNFLTPEAAFLTSDLLAARAREADRQGSPAKTADIETASDRSL